MAAGWRGEVHQTVKELLGIAPEHGFCPGGKAGVAQDQRCVWENELGQHWKKNPGKKKDRWEGGKMHSRLPQASEGELATSESQRGSEEVRQQTTEEIAQKSGTWLSNTQGRSKPVHQMMIKGMKFRGSFAQRSGPEKRRCTCLLIFTSYSGRGKGNADPAREEAGPTI